ncbi:MAG: SLATT domain-containing protein [Vallitalea sp.]|nr:SLATT domain-containing protein [Vallitalea sp.]
MPNITELKRRIWITKKSRIEASERLKKKNDLYQWVSVYYSIVIVMLSIWNIKPVDNGGNINLGISNSSLLLLIASIALSLFSMFITSRNYQERYYNLKSNYIEIGKLYTKISQLENEDNNDSKQVLQIEQEYNNLLALVENHETIDFYRIIMKADEEREKLSEEKLKEIKWTIKKHDCMFFLSNAIFVLVPFFSPLLIRLLDFCMNLV